MANLNCDMPATYADHADIVIVGSGVAGLTTALAASQAGLKPLVLEKTDAIGGVSCWSYGSTWIGANEDAALAGLDDDDAAVGSYLAFLGGGENDPTRTAAFVAGASGMLRRLRDAGVDFNLLRGMNDLLANRAPGAAADGRTFEPALVDGRTIGPNRARLRTPPGPREWRLDKSTVVRSTDGAALAAALAEAESRDQLGQGIGLVAQLLRALDAQEVTILTGCNVERLLVEHNRIVGVATDDGRGFAAGRGVMLATGNYLADRALVAALDGIPDYRPWCPPGATGDGLRMAAAVGGSIRTTRNNRGIFLGFDDPNDPEGACAGLPSTRELSRAHSIVVNRAGQRFSNEGFFQQTALTLRTIDPATRTPANLPCWMIFDQNYADTWGLAGSAPGNVPDWVDSAADIASLADRISVDRHALTATVVRFNGFAESGVDEDFGRAPGWKMAPTRGTGKNPALGPIVRAPFYAIRLWPTLGIGGSGIKADAAARVLDWRDTPVAGLYAAGDVALHDEFGTGYQAGLTLAAAMYFAFAAVDDLAGQHAAANDRKHLSP